MRRRELLNKLGQVAKATGTSFEFVREGGDHSVYRINGTNLIIPRHREITERTAKSIIKQAQKEAQK